MSIDIATVNHICKVVSRQIHDEFPGVTLLFIPYKAAEPAKSLSARQHELRQYPPGDDFVKTLKSLSEKGLRGDHLAGLAVWEERKWVLFTQEKALAVMLLELDALENEDDARWHVLHLAGQALGLLEDYRNRHDDQYRLENGIMHRTFTHEADQGRENMLADAFAALMLYSGGQKAAIQSLARKRCIMALKPLPGYRAEDYPYPIAAEATGIVLEEFSQFQGTTASKPVTNARMVTQEIAYTFDDLAIQQWQSFAIAAQEMAWSGYEKNKILQTAIYTSEDPYVRSMAYLAAEFLSIDPQPLTDLGTYNPFTAREANERLHIRICQQTFRRLTEKSANIARDIDAEISDQNRKLLDGFVTGWCVPALIKVKEAYSRPGPDRFKDAGEQFQAALKEIPANALFDLRYEIFREKRAGTAVTPETVRSLCQNNKLLSRLVAEYF